MCFDGSQCLTHTQSTDKNSRWEFVLPRLMVLLDDLGTRWNWTLGHTDSGFHTHERSQCWVLCFERYPTNSSMWCDVMRCMFVCLVVCLFVCTHVCPYVSIYLSVCLSVCMSICLSVCLPVWLSVYLCVCLSICLSVCLSAYLASYLFIYLSI